MNNRYHLDQSILLLYYIPGKSEFISPHLLFETIHVEVYISRSALVPSGDAVRDGRPSSFVLIPPQLKHAEDGIVHLDQYSQVDRQAGLAVLSGRSACEPGEGVVLLQNKPEHIGGGL